jgi:hypothetical protein
MFGLDPEAARQVLLFLILWSFFAGVGVIVGKKKGVSPAAAILGSFPLWVAIFAFWLVKQPDIHPD